MKIRILKRFNDIHTKAQYYPGDVIDVTEERFAEINRNLPGFVEAIKPKRTKKTAK